MSKYISVVNTAKLVRQALKVNFPKTKFSVRSSSYSGGASITVSWTDGETTAEVDPVIRQFAGADFDGMIDLKSYHDSVLNGDEVVHFGADFVFSNRKTSISFRMKVANAVCAYFKLPVPPMNRWNWFDRTPDTSIYPMNGHEDLLDVFNQVMWATNADNGTLHGTSGYVPGWIEAIWAAFNTQTSAEQYPILREGANYTPDGSVIISADLLDEMVGEGSAEVVELTPELLAIATPDEGLVDLLDDDPIDETPPIRVSAETLQPIIKPDTLRAKLASINVDVLSPLEALTLLYELKRLA